MAVAGERNSTRSDRHGVETGAIVLEASRTDPVRRLPQEGGNSRKANKNRLTYAGFRIDETSNVDVICVS